MELGVYGSAQWRARPYDGMKPEWIEWYNEQVICVIKPNFNHDSPPWTGESHNAIEKYFQEREQHIASAGLNWPWTGACGVVTAVKHRFAQGNQATGEILMLFDNMDDFNWFEGWTLFSWSCRFATREPVCHADWDVTPCCDVRLRPNEVKWLHRMRLVKARGGCLAGMISI